MVTLTRSSRFLRLRRRGLAPLGVLLAAGCSSSSTSDPGKRDSGFSDDANATTDAASAADGSTSKHDGRAREDSGHDGDDAGPSQGDASDDADPGPNATLTALDVSPLKLYPTFAPDIHDYYVRCKAGTNSLTVTAIAASGAEAQLTKPTKSASAAKEVVGVSATPNDAIVATASAGGKTTEYWVRCLPPDFPKMSFETHPLAGTPAPGYYLLGNVAVATGEQGYAMVLDQHGTPVWYHTTATGGGPANIDLIAPNTISYVPHLDYTFTDMSSAAYELHTLDPKKLKYVTTHGIPLDLHELQVLPNGDYLAFGWPITTGVDLTGLSTYGTNESMVNCDIQEISPSGDVVWQWRAIDHFDPVKDCTWPQTEKVTDSMGVQELAVDPFHCNSIDVDPSGNLLVSARHMDSVFMIEKSTGKVLWKLGGASDSKDGAIFMKLQGDSFTSFYRQHDARLQGGSLLSMFDDQTAKSNPARALVLSYDLTAGTAAVVWEYKNDVSSTAEGSFRILPDGSRIIGWGLTDPHGPHFTEVDVDENDLIDFNFTDGDNSYRTIKVPMSDLDLGTLRSTAGQPD